MIYQMGWQRLLITQVPQGCGGGGGGGAQQCVVTDYHAQWGQVQSLYNSVLAEIPKIQAENLAISSIKDNEGNTARVQAEIALNAHIDRVLADANQALAIDATIPSSWFSAVDCVGGGGTASTNNLLAHDDSKRQFENVVRTLANYKTTVEKEYYNPTVTFTWVPPVTKQQILRDQVAALEKRLGSMQRWFGKAIEPEPAANVYPRGSWQYSLWTYGYSLKEIAWAESDAKTGDFVNKYGNDFEYLLNVIKVDLDNAIINGKIVKENNGEEATFVPGLIDSNPGIIPTPPDLSGHWYAPNGVAGTGIGGPGYLYPPGYKGSGTPPKPGDVLQNFTFYLDPNATDGVPQTIIVNVSAPPGTPNTSPPAQAVLAASLGVKYGVQFSSGPWRQYNMLPSPPRKIEPLPGMPIDSEYYRIYRRRYHRSGWHNANPYQPRNPWKNPDQVVPWIDTLTPVRDPITPPYDPRGWCGTGDTGAHICGKPNTGFEPWLMGQGYTPDQIDTVRRVVRPGVGGQRRIRPGKGMVCSKDPVVLFGQVQALGTAIANDTSIAKVAADAPFVSAMDNSSVTQMSVAARRQATRARRALHR